MMDAIRVIVALWVTAFVVCAGISSMWPETPWLERLGISAWVALLVTANIVVLIGVWWWAVG